MLCMVEYLGSLIVLFGAAILVRGMKTAGDLPLLVSDDPRLMRF